MIALAAPASAQTVAPYPAGHQISLYVGTDPGGMNDTLMRIVSRHIGKYLPGNPQVVAKNMPGAGGRKLATYLFTQAQRDGTEFGVFQRAISTDPLLMDPTLPFEMPKFTWIGTPSSTTDICAVWHDAPIKKIEDIQQTELILAGSGGETAQMNLLINLLGGKVRAIVGFPGGPAMNLAMERGEVHGRCALSWEATKTSYADWLKENKIKPIVQFALKKNADLPNVPLITDFAKTDDDRKALEIILAPQSVGFPFVAPPGVLPEVKTMLREAFTKSLKDPAAIAEAAKIGFEFNEGTGADLEKLMANVYANPPTVVGRAKALIAGK
jgi:tripartite-type tricarboxylate transporter receptor subunit TctC